MCFLSERVKSIGSIWWQKARDDPVTRVTASRHSRLKWSMQSEAGRDSISFLKALMTNDTSFSLEYST